MPDLKSHISTLWLTSSLAMLALVLVAPFRTSGVVSVIPRPGCLSSRDFAAPPGRSTTHLRAAMATDAVLRVCALLSEGTEQTEADALDEPRVPCTSPISSCKVSDRQLIAPRSILSLYPLRC